MSLRIPLAVRRCPPTRPNDRIRYEHRGRCLTPEAIVLRRWQARSQEPSAVNARIRFDGCRLPPATWSIVQECLAAGLIHREAADPTRLADCIARIRARHPTWRAPHATKLAAVIRFLDDRGALERVLSATRSATNPGLPDLFLYRQSEARGVHGGRFVEVKRSVRRTRYKERLSPGQRQEHQLLRSLGLRVDVVYLLE